MHRGYIKLWRKIEDSFIWKDPEALMIWVRLMMKANYKDTEFMFNYKKMILKRGQLINGLTSLSSETGISKSKCYRVLKMLKNETLIEIQETNRYSTITIVKYSDYQDNETLIETPVKHQRNTSETPVKTSKELISIKKNNNNIEHPFLTNPRIAEAFAHFLDMRKAIKKPATDRAKYLILDRLSKETVETAVAMLEQSTVNSWQGIFALKEDFVIAGKPKSKLPDRL